MSRTICAGAVLAGLLAACGGGGDNYIGPPDSILLTPASLTVQGPPDACAAGAAATVFVYGGDPPYDLKNSVPQAVVLDRSTVRRSGEGFTVTFLGACLQDMPIAVEDRMGRVTTLSLNNVKGS
jgi:hypothetical protein